jgi:hypothetical protein
VHCPDRTLSTALQFPRWCAYKRICHQFHCKARDCVPIVIVHLRQQFGQLSGIYARTVLRPGFGQNVPRLEVRRRVRLATSRAIAYRKICDVVSCARLATSLDCKHEFPNVSSRYPVNELVTKRREYVRFQTPPDGICMTRGLAHRPPFEPHSQSYFQLHAVVLRFPSVWRQLLPCVQP